MSHYHVRWYKPNNPIEDLIFKKHEKAKKIYDEAVQSYSDVTSAPIKQEDNDQSFFSDGTIIRVFECIKKEHEDLLEKSDEAQPEEKKKMKHYHVQVIAVLGPSSELIIDKEQTAVARYEELVTAYCDGAGCDIQTDGQKEVRFVDGTMIRWFDCDNEKHNILLQSSTEIQIRPVDMLDLVTIDLGARKASYKENPFLLLTPQTDEKALREQYERALDLCLYLRKQIYQKEKQ